MFRQTYLLRLPDDVLQQRVAAAVGCELRHWDPLRLVHRQVAGEHRALYHAENDGVLLRSEKDRAGQRRM